MHATTQTHTHVCVRVHVYMPYIQMHNTSNTHSQHTTYIHTPHTYTHHIHTPHIHTHHIHTYIKIRYMHTYIRSQNIHILVFMNSDRHSSWTPLPSVKCNSRDPRVYFQRWYNACMNMYTCMSVDSGDFPIDVHCMLPTCDFVLHDMFVCMHFCVQRYMHAATACH
jgi:hypothetical protein